jgi:hypothetical protein
MQEDQEVAVYREQLPERKDRQGMKWQTRCELSLSLKTGLPTRITYFMAKEQERYYLT